MTSLEISAGVVSIIGLLFIFRYYRVENASRLWRKVGILIVALGTFILLCDQGYMQAITPKVSAYRGCKVTTLYQGKIYTENRCK